MLPLYVHLPAFYADEVGVGLAAVGGALLVARLWDVITDPVAGLLSDRISTPWGRRRPWMIAGLPLVLVAAWFLFQPLEGVGWLYLVGWTMALYLGGSLIQLPYTAWGAELSPDYHERSRISAAREVFVVIGTLLAAGLPALVGDDRAEVLRLLAWGLLFVLPVAVVVCCALVPDAPVVRRQSLRPRESLAILAGNGPFRRLIVAYFLNGIANGLPATLFLLFVEHVLKAPGWSGPLLFIYFCAGIGAVPLWLHLSRRWGKHRVWMAAMVWACAIFVLVPLLGAGDTWWFLAVCVLTGTALGADLVLPASMQADVIDLDTLRSGQRRAGLYFALWGVATKLALALGVGIAFPALEWAGFSTEAEVNTASSLFALAALYSLVPVAFKLLSIGLMRGYPITQARQEDIRRRIENAATAPGV